jgi:hypothetical protein
VNSEAEKDRITDLRHRLAAAREKVVFCSLKLVASTRFIEDPADLGWETAMYEEWLDQAVAAQMKVQAELERETSE